MKDLYEVLRQKEQDYKRLGKEIEALRITAALLAEEREQTTKSVDPAVVLTAAANQSGPRAVEEPISRWP